jgi:hypothetical protein
MFGMYKLVAREAVGSPSFVVGATYVMAGQPRCAPGDCYGFHAFRDARDCYRAWRGHTGADVLLVVELAGAVVFDSDMVTAWATSLRIVGLATVDLQEGLRVEEGLLTGCLNLENGTQQWYQNGRLHREGDLPAVQSPTRQLWYREGLLHRDDDKPAVQEECEWKWYRLGKLHRDHDKPAVMNGSGQKWYCDGELHREGDKPAVVRNDAYGGGYEAWYWRGKLHRGGDQPAMMFKAHDLKQWAVDGLLHRDGDMPAETGGGVMRWFRRGVLHRDDDKPAIVETFSGTCKWYRLGVLHREGNMPAIYRKGGVYQVWYRHGSRITVKTGADVPEGSIS